MSDSHRRSYGFRTVLRLVSALVFSTVAAVAQLSTASLNGVVRDTTGASVSRASVTLHNSDTGVERNTLTNDVGTYVFSDINPGRYTLRVTAPSFSSKQVSDFVLAVNQTATIDIALDCKAKGEPKTILFNLSGHGLLDLKAYEDRLSGNLVDYEPDAESLRNALQSVPVVA